MDIQSLIQKLRSVIDNLDQTFLDPDNPFSKEWHEDLSLQFDNLVGFLEDRSSASSKKEISLIKDYLHALKEPAYSFSDTLKALKERALKCITFFEKEDPEVDLKDRAVLAENQHLFPYIEETDDVLTEFEHYLSIHSMIKPELPVVMHHVSEALDELTGFHKGGASGNLENIRQLQSHIAFLESAYSSIVSARPADKLVAKSVD